MKTSRATSVTQIKEKIVKEGLQTKRELQKEKSKSDSNKMRKN